MKGQAPLFEPFGGLHDWQRSRLLNPAPGADHALSTDTERAAARDVAPRTGTLRAKILRALRAAPDGLTTWELHERVGGLLYSVAPRVPELVKAGLVEDSGRRRITPSGSLAAVWVLTPRGAA